MGIAELEAVVPESVLEHAVMVAATATAKPIATIFVPVFVVVLID
ncbi:hypothetical protein [Gordonia sp. (in: high G+C Gram-positive bacteria)]